MNRRILRLAIPNIISNLSVPLLGAVDTALMGHLDEVHYLGAIAVAGIIFDFIYWGFGFLRMGTTGLTAQAFGQEDDGEVILLLTRTVIFAVLGAGILIALQKAIAEISFVLINATPEVEKYAREYFHIRIYAAPATLTLYAFHGWCLGLQNARYPLFLTVIVNAVNVVLNFVFILGFQMKSEGVAYGTLIAQYAGLITACVLFFRTYSSYLPRIQRRFIFEAKAVKRLLALNRDIFIRTLGLIFTFSYFTAKSAEMGDMILAVNSILLQLITIMAYGVDGFAFAAESLVGRYVGAQDRTNLRTTVYYSFGWGLGLSLAFAVTFVVVDEGLVRIFTDNEAVVALAMSYFLWIVIAPLTNSACFIWDGIFIGATAAREMRNSMTFSTLLVFLPTYLLLREYIGNHSLWLALTLFMIARGVTLTLYARKTVLQPLSIM
ncbi:MATE family efflux transporter [bacterium]|nr:MATE family efflux transporter [bacterium]